MRSRANGYVDRIRTELRKSFTQEYTPQEIAGSFALGVFITMLPTLGVGLVVFVVLAYLFERINKIALFASVLVLNPVVKWGVYAASISLGFFLLGPVDGFDGGAITLGDGREVLIRLWVGNLMLAVVATAIAYPLVRRMVMEYQDRELAVVGKTVDVAVEELEAVGWGSTHSTSESTPTQPEDHSDEPTTENPSDRSHTD